MKALIKAQPEPGLWLEDVAEPELGINDVLVRINRTGICGTDLSIFNWDAWARETIPVPMVVGHECVGEVVETGSNASDFQPGAIVSGEGHVVCGTCRNCLAGRRHLCADTRGIGVNRPGAFAEYLVLPMTNIWHHAPDVDLDVASIFDPFGNAVHTALSFPVLGEDVPVTGAGPIGAMAVAVARHAGARYVVATDVNPYRMELARQMGATLVLDARTESLPCFVKRLRPQHRAVGEPVETNRRPLLMHPRSVPLLAQETGGRPVDAIVYCCERHHWHLVAHGDQIQERQGVREKPCRRAPCRFVDAALPPKYRPPTEWSDHCPDRAPFMEAGTQTVRVCPPVPAR